MSKKPSSALSAGRPSTARGKEAMLSELADTAKTKRVNVQLTIEDHTRLKMHAAREGRTISDVIIEFVRALPKG